MHLSWLLMLRLLCEQIMLALCLHTSAYQRCDSSCVSHAFTTYQYNKHYLRTLFVVCASRQLPPSLHWLAHGWTYPLECVEDWMVWQKNSLVYSGDLVLISDKTVQ